MNFVIYYRVSTKRQERSGLGLEAQQAAAEQYVQQTGGIIRGSYQEAETGRRDSREELAKALAHTRRLGGVLIIAKLDRLARDVAFISAIMKSGVEFVCCDMPAATKFTIHIMAAVAEQEADAISQRTKDALAAYKARGGKLGASDPRCKSITAIPGAWEKGQRLGAATTKSKAQSAYSDILPLMTAMKGRGDSLKAIAAHLNSMGHSTRTDKQWSATQVKRVLDRVQPVELSA
jgi:DNA invertase Pin-like site-specific DNA recombinase